MVKGCYVDSNGIKKGAWSEEEDNRLKQFIMTHGHPNWRVLPKFAGLARSGKSCRLRWVNYLKPGVRRGKYNKEEVALIIELHAELGNKWSAIAKYLPGRTDNDIKNYWNANMRKQNKLKKKTSIQELLLSGESENSISSLDNASSAELHDTKTSWDSHSVTQVNYFESFEELNFDKLLSPNPYISIPYYYLSEETSCSSDPFAETQDDFWTEPGGGLFYSLLLFSPTI